MLKTILIGHLCGDIKASNTSGTSGYFHIACKDPVDFKKSHFFWCKLTNKTFAYAQKYLQKGDKVLIEGNLLTYKKHNLTNCYIQVNDIQLLLSKKYLNKLKQEDQNSLESQPLQELSDFNFEIFDS